MKERENCLVKAGFAGSAVEAVQMLNFLSRHEIAASAAAGSLTVYEGNSPSGQAILVAEEDAARAKELLHGFAPIRTYAFRKGNREAAFGRGLSAVLMALCMLFLLMPFVLLFAKQLF